MTAPIKIQDAAAEPLTLAEAKSHLRETLVNADNDAYIRALIQAVRVTAEDELQRTLLHTTWLLTLDAFPVRDGGVIRLPFPPLASVAWVKYVDPAGVEQTLDPAAYVLRKDAEPGQLLPAYGSAWPAARCMPGAVRVQYVAGYAAGTTEDPADKIPAPIRWWCRCAIEELYRNRGLDAKLPAGFASGLLDMYRIRSL